MKLLSSRGSFILVLELPWFISFFSSTSHKRLRGTEGNESCRFESRCKSPLVHRFSPGLGKEEMQGKWCVHSLRKVVWSIQSLKGKYGLKTDYLWIHIKEFLRRNSKTVHTLTRAPWRYRNLTKLAWPSNSQQASWRSLAVLVSPDSLQWVW